MTINTIVPAELIQHNYTEEQLKQLQEFNTSIVQNMAEGIAIEDDKGYFTFVNPAACELLGYTTEELVCQHWTIIVPPDQHSIVMEADQRRAHGKRDRYELELLRKDSQRVTVLVAGSPRIDTQTGRFGGTLAVFSDITDRKRAEEEVQRRAGEFAALYESARDLATGPDLSTLLNTIVQRAINLLGAASGGVYLYDAVRQELCLTVSIGYPIPLGLRIKLGEGMAGRVAQTLEPLIVDDYHTWPYRSPQYEGIAIGVVVEVPILYAGNLIGVLAVHAMGDNSRRFSENDARLLSLFAAQVASLVHGAHSFAETKQQAERLALLNRIARALGTTLNLDELLEIVYREISIALSAHTFFVALYDASTTELDFRIRVDADIREPVGRRLLSPGLTSFVISNRKPLLIRDYSREKDKFPAVKTWGTMQPTQSWLGVPMLVGEKLVGVISVQAYEPNVYDEGDQELLSTIADTVAVAIENARHFEAEQTGREELSALYSLSRSLADARTVDEISTRVAQHVTETIHVTCTRVILLEAESLVVRAVYPIRSFDSAQTNCSPIILSEHRFLLPALCQDTPFTVLAERPEVDEVEREFLFLRFAKTALLVPLRVGERVLGVIILNEARSEEREPFTPEKIRLARSIGDQAVSAIHRATLREQTERRLQRLDSLRLIDRSINSSLDLEMALAILLDQMTAQLHVDAARVLLLAEKTRVLRCAGERGFRMHTITPSSLRLGEGFASQAVLERHLVSVPNLSESDSSMLCISSLAEEGIVAYYAIPLVAKGQVKGVLEVFHRTALRPDEEWLNFLETLAGQAAIAINNGELFSSLQQSNLNLALAYDATIEGWSHALDLRDKETEGHTRRVVELTLRLARFFGLTEAELTHVKRGALLHDIGKMGVPDAILLKPGPLTEAEWEIMRKHPVFAYEMLSRIAYLDRAGDIPYCHHEKWDGTGYPRGLKGEEIPLTARIFAVVDVWDALRSDRPYRAAWPVERVREHIRVASGTHFDPRVVEAFFKLQESDSGVASMIP